MSHPTPIQLEALVRLWRIANRDTGQSRRVAAFLLGLYNGPRFKFDLTDCRGVDTEILRDMLTVLVMDSRPWAEVHELLAQALPGERVDFERLAADWGYINREAP